MSVDHRSVEQKVRALLAERGLSQSLFSGARLLEQQQASADGRLRYVATSGRSGRPGALRFRPRREGGR